MVILSILGLFICSCSSPEKQEKYPDVVAEMLKINLNPSAIQ